MILIWIRFLFKTLWRARLREHHIFIITTVNWIPELCFELSNPIRFTSELLNLCSKANKFASNKPFLRTMMSSEYTCFQFKSRLYFQVNNDNCDNLNSQTLIVFQLPTFLHVLTKAQPKQCTLCWHNFTY